MKIYWTVRINYGGGAVKEAFRTEEEAKKFYDDHNYCDPPERFFANNSNDYEWAEDRINMREIAEEFEKSQN